MKAKDYKFCVAVGPGGLKCPCCGDKDSKKRANRKFRRSKKEAVKEA